MLACPYAETLYIDNDVVMLNVSKLWKFFTVLDRRACTPAVSSDVDEAARAGWWANWF